MPDYHEGVVQKMNSYIRIGGKYGKSSGISFIKSKNIFNQIWRFREIIKNTQIEVIIIRFPGLIRLIVILPYLISVRLSGRRICIEIPTPLSTVKLEIKGFVFGLRRYVHLLLLYFTPFVLNIAANRIVQYGKEDFYFHILLKNKSKQISNPFPVLDLLIDRTDNLSDTLRFVNCSYLHYWHGIDRILDSLSIYINDSSTTKSKIHRVHFDIIGDGPELEKLIKKVSDLKLNNFVTFYGKLDFEQSVKIISAANIGIGTLGSSRVNLREGSPLKHRDYFVCGIPFILDLEDPDFSSNCDFVYRISNPGIQSLDLSDIINWYLTLYSKSGNSKELLKNEILKTNILKKNEDKIYDSLFCY